MFIIELHRQFLHFPVNGSKVQLGSHTKKSAPTFMSGWLLRFNLFGSAQLILPIGTVVYRLKAKL